MKTKIFILDGTGENLVRNTLLDSSLKRLDQKKYQLIHVPYPADYGLRASYSKSVSIGLGSLSSCIQDAERFYIFGYSQGATVAGKWAQLNGHDKRCLGVGLIADPERAYGTHSVFWGFAPNTCGVAGSRPIKADFPVYHLANPKDPITCLEAGSPMRSIADLSEFMGLNIIEWGQDLIEKANSRRWQRWWDVGNWRTWTGLIDQLRRYLFGEHTSAYVGAPLDQLVKEVTGETRLG